MHPLKNAALARRTPIRDIGPADHALGRAVHLHAGVDWALRTGVCSARRGMLSQREKVTGRPFDRQIGPTKRGDRCADCRIRIGVAFDRHICYVTGDREWSSRESRPKELGEGLTRCSWGLCVGSAVASGAARKLASLLPSRTAKSQCVRNGQKRPQCAGRSRKEKAEFERQGVVDRRNGSYRSWLLTELGRPYARGHARPAHRGLRHSSRNHVVINVPWQASQSPDHDHASPGNHLYGP